MLDSMNGRKNRERVTDENLEAGAGEGDVRPLDTVRATVGPSIVQRRVQRVYLHFFGHLHYNNQNRDSRF